MPNIQNFYHIKNSKNFCGKRLSEVAIPFYNIVGGNRISSKMRYTCPDEIIYDSYLPRIDDILSVEGAYPSYQSFPISSSTTVPKESVGMYIFSSQPATWYAAGETPVSPLKNPKYSEWFRSYPFENKYSSLLRSQIPDRYLSFEFLDGKERYVDQVTFQIPLREEPTATSEANDRIVLYDNSFAATASLSKIGHHAIPPTTNEVYKFFFGIGNGMSYLTNSVGGVIQSFVGMPKFYSIHPFHEINNNIFKRGNVSPGVSAVDLYPITMTASVGSGVEISGWKYGIYNAFPTPTTCVFRRNSYGQFRDMLEQRPFTVFFDQKSQKPLTGPVEVKFMKQVTSSSLGSLSGSTDAMLGSYVRVDPYLTDTQNKSTYATSSVPYADI